MSQTCCKTLAVAKCLRFQNMYVFKYLAKCGCFTGFFGDL